jgi:hypothetical protein
VCRPPARRGDSRPDEEPRYIRTDPGIGISYRLAS